MEEQLLSIITGFAIFIGITSAIIAILILVKLVCEISALRSQKDAFDLAARESQLNIELLKTEAREKQATSRSSDSRTLHR